MWSTINALQVFDEIYVTTRGGPLQATTVIVYYLYKQAFAVLPRRLRAPRSPTCSSLITLVISLIQLWVGNRRVHYTS